jgi:hypothetical protein
LLLQDLAEVGDLPISSDSGIRTRTGWILSPLPLPLGYVA